MDWTDTATLEATGDRRFRAHVSDAWSSLQGVHGGVVAALLVSAADEVVRARGADPSATMRAATFGYVSGNAVGDLDIEVETIRQGRALVTTHVRAAQNGRTTTVARLHHSTPWDGAAFSDAPPMVAKPAATVRLDTAAPVAHLANVETHLHPTTRPFAGAERAEWLAWCRPHHGGTFDAAWLTMLGDYFPPAVFVRSTAPSHAVTVEYAIQIHDAAGRWTLADGDLLAARMHAFHAHDGFAVEDGWIHLPGGTLLATVRQTRLAG